MTFILTPALQIPGSRLDASFESAPVCTATCASGQPRAATVAYEEARGTLHLSFARLRLCVHPIRPNHLDTVELATREKDRPVSDIAFRQCLHPVRLPRDPSPDGPANGEPASWIADGSKATGPLVLCV